MVTTMQVPFIIVITKVDVASEMQILLTRYDVIILLDTNYIIRANYQEILCIIGRAR